MRCLPVSVNSPIVSSRALYEHQHKHPTHVKSIKAHTMAWRNPEFLLQQRTEWEWLLYLATSLQFTKHYIFLLCFLNICYVQLLHWTSMISIHTRKKNSSSYLSRSFLHCYVSFSVNIKSNQKQLNLTTALLWQWQFKKRGCFGRWGPGSLINIFVNL